MDKESLYLFVNQRKNEFKLHYGCTQGGWPDDNSLQIDLISFSENTYKITIWFDEIVSKACSCMGDNNEIYTSRIVANIHFVDTHHYTITIDN